MGVDNYKTIKKQSVDDFIKDAERNVCVITSVPIEHYTQTELKQIADKAKDRGLIVTIKAEYSNFYQGVLIGLIHKEDASQEYKDYM